MSAPSPTRRDLVEPTAALAKITGADRVALQTAVMAWGRRHRRDLPWRRTRNPWAVMVAELMLQQTQVVRVVPKFEAFMARFATPSVCAAAPTAAVIDSWAGLGYNRRAVHLHLAAQRMVEHHGGLVPRGLDELLTLPGIGPYTARAIQTFAFEVDVGVVDTNVSRLLARWTATTVSGVHAQELADAFVPEAEGWSWNQMMFDLGSAVCTRRAPSCGECPAAPWCHWRGRGPDPAAPAGRQSKFHGSDRQGRGALIAALRLGPVADEGLPAAMGWPDDPDRARRVAQTLVGDGLACLDERTRCWALP